MEIAACQLYVDKTHVELNVPIDAKQQKYLLTQSRHYFLSLRVEGSECDLERISGRGVLNILPNKALVVSAELGAYAFQGLVTINRFGSGCVITQYTQLLADEPFALNFSADARRRAVIDTLQSVELIDHFFLLHHAMDALGEFVRSSVVHLREEAVEQQACRTYL